MAIRFETTSSIPFFWYPGSQLIMCEGRLYNDRGVMNQGNTMILVDMLTRDPVPKAVVCFKGGDRIFPEKYLLNIAFLNSVSYTLFYSQHGAYKIALHTHKAFYDGINPPMRLIQRNIRNLARASILRKQKQFAVVMAGHERLGAGSLFGLLDPDLLRAICASV